MLGKEHWRLGLFFSAVVFLFVIVLLRLFKIQVLEQRKYQILAARQHGFSYLLPAARGKIYTADGFPLVTNETSYLLYATPSKVEDPRGLAQSILDALSPFAECPVVNFVTEAELSPEDLLSACEHEAVRRLAFDREWVPLARGITFQEKERLESLDLVGIGFEKTPRRFYPEGRLGAHLLGFVGSDEEGKPRGYYGLEGFYDGDLRGSVGKIVEERSAMGEPILAGKYKRRPSRPGRDLTLTIDRAVQFIVEGHLREGVTRYGAESGTVIVMEPQTGKILALANWPSYDPARPVAEKAPAEASLPEEEDAVGEGDSVVTADTERIERRNLAIASSYEPGSVLKALTMAAAIDAGKITPQTTFQSQPLTLGSYVIRTWDNKYYGEETMTEVLEHSDNTGAAWVALERLGKRILRDYFLKFGLGEETGIDLEGEASGIVKPLSEWRPIDLANASFGQGISVTPLQLVTAFSAIANRGLLMRPYLVSDICDEEREISFSPKEVRRVISEDSAKVVVEMLARAAEHGEAQFFVIKDYKVAGKTGTAQIPVGGRYDPHQTNATFVGFMPESLKFVMLVKLEKPQASTYAAETAVPLWMGIAKDLIGYYGISPDR